MNVSLMVYYGLHHKDSRILANPINSANPPAGLRSKITNVQVLTVLTVNLGASHYIAFRLKV